MFQASDGQLQRRILTQRLHLRQQRRLKAIALMIDIRIGKEQIFGDLAQLGIGETADFRFLLLRRLIKSEVWNSVCAVFRQLPGRQRVIVALHQLAAPDAMVGKVFLHHHRQFGIVMQDFYRMPRAEAAVDQQRFRFDARPIQRQRRDSPTQRT